MDQKNMIIAIVLAMAIIFGFQYLYEVPRQKEAMQRAEELAASEQSLAPQPGPESAGGQAAAPGGVAETAPSGVDSRSSRYAGLTSWA